MEEVVVRRARREDIPAVMEVNIASLPENYWYGFYEEFVEKWSEAFLVAEIGGEIVGYAMSRIEQQRDPVLLGLRSELEEAPKSILARIADEVASYLTIEPQRVGHLVSIAVLAPYRGRGIGSRLLSESIRVVRDVYGAVSMYLEVRVSNTIAIRLYEKHGFRKARLIKSYYADGEDAYVMVKRLR
ncbi:MAG: GNAT family N-acetyltransferase [Acidilobaceae archaeon]